jgi:hypothetical protein
MYTGLIIPKGDGMGATSADPQAMAKIRSTECVCKCSFEYLLGIDE